MVTWLRASKWEISSSDLIRPGFNFIHILKVEVGSKGESILHTASPFERWHSARNTTPQ